MWKIKFLGIDIIQVEFVTVLIHQLFSGKKKQCQILIRIFFAVIYAAYLST